MSLNAAGNLAAVGSPYSSDSGSNTGSVLVFLRHQNTWTQSARLLAEDKRAQSFFGARVALSRDGATLLVSAMFSNNNGANSGSAYVFERDGVGWEQKALLVPTDGAAGDSFGVSISVNANGTGALICAEGDDDKGVNSGSAYVFERNTSGNWQQTARIVPADGTPGAKFGFSSGWSEDGSLAAMGAPADSFRGTLSGSVFIYERVGSSWIQRVKIAGSNTAANDEFGSALSLSADGHALAIGAPGASPQGARSGATYVFLKRNASMWQEVRIITASDGAAGAAFGAMVSLSGDGNVALVGAQNASGNGTNSGMAYVYSNLYSSCSDGWYLSNSTCQRCNCSAFGSTQGSDSICNRTTGLCPCRTGYAGQTCASCGAGFYQVSSDNACVVSARRIIDSRPFPSSDFGSAVAIDSNGTTVVVGAPRNNSKSHESGGVALFRANASNVLVKHEYDLPHGVSAGDRLGIAVVVAGDGSTAVLGAPNTSHIGDRGAGAVYVLVRNGTLWATRQRLEASDAAAGDAFGTALALSENGSAILVGAPNRSNAVGAVYEYVLSGTAWNQRARLVASESVPGASFGAAIAISGNGTIAAIGVPQQDVPDLAAERNRTGAVHLFRQLSDGSWMLHQILQAANASAGDAFGSAVAMSVDGATIAVGAPGTDHRGDESGSVVLFSLRGSAWVETAVLLHSAAHAGDLLGGSIALSESGNVLIAGARNASALSERAGAAVAFRQTGNSTWRQAALLTEPNGSPGSGFGASVAISGDGKRILVGSPQRREGLLPSGSAYDMIRFYSACADGEYLVDGECMMCGCVSVGVQSLSSICTIQNGQCPCASGYGGRTCAICASGYATGVHGTCVVATSISSQMKSVMTDASASDLAGRSVALSGNGSIAFVGAVGDDDKGSGSGSVYELVRRESGWEHSQKIVPSDGNAMQQFGTSVSCSANASVLLVGSPYDDDRGENAGSAYIFSRSGSAWTQRAKLLPADLQSGDLFAVSVAISANGSVALAGTRAGDGIVPDSGTAYLFVQDGSTWTQRAKLFAPDGKTNQLFGYTVSMSGNAEVVIIGSVAGDGIEAATGAAFVYQFNGAAWAPAAKLMATDVTGGAYFGVGIALSHNGSRALVSAKNGVGAVYEFARNDIWWSQAARIVASDGLTGRTFGESVALSADGSVALIGSHHDSIKGAQSGSAYFYVRGVDGWIAGPKIVATDGAAGDEFGHQVAVSGDGSAAVVGALQNDHGAADTGAAYFYALCPIGTYHDGATCAACACADVGVASTSAACNATTGACQCRQGYVGRTCSDCAVGWDRFASICLPVEKILLANDTAAGDQFGSVALDDSGSIAVIGAAESRNNGTTAGSVYIFTATETEWTQIQELVPADGATAGQFGHAVAVSGTAEYILVGARGGIEKGIRTGSAYVYRRSGSTPVARWTLLAKLVAADGANLDRFGHSVALSQDGAVAVIGAPNTDGGGSGAGSAYVFRRTGTSWASAGSLKAPDAVEGDQFGESVAVSANGSVIVLGVPGDDDNGSASGSAIIFVLGNSSASLGGEGAPPARASLVLARANAREARIVTPDDDSSRMQTLETASDPWSQQSKLVAADGSPGHRFGCGVAVSGDGNTVVVGALGATGSENGTGAAYIFVRSGAVWSQLARLQAGDGQSGDLFGASVALARTGTILLVHAQAGAGAASRSGAAYIYVLSGDVWRQSARLSARDGNANDCFGQGVLSSDGNVALIGSHHSDQRGNGSGSAYVFKRFSTVCPEGTYLANRTCETCSCVANGTASGSTGSDATEKGCARQPGYRARTNTEPLLPHDGTTSATNGPSAAAALEAGCVPGDVHREVAHPNQTASHSFWRWFDMDTNATRIAIGAHGDSVAERGRTGAVHLFGWNNTRWSHTHTVVGADSQESDEFGCSVALSADARTLVVGAYHDDDRGSHSGSAFVFRLLGNEWQEQAKLLASDGASDDHFGLNVAISGDSATVLVGARERDDQGAKSGAAYVYTTNGTQWTQHAKLLASDGAASRWFGDYVMLSHNGTLAYVCQRLTTAGAVYVFERNVTGWFQRAKLSATDGANADGFGTAMARSMDDNVLLIGAQYDDDNGTDSGSAYVFVRTGLSWTERAKITPPNGAAGNRFAFHLSLSDDGTRALISSIFAQRDGNKTGTVHLFEQRSADTWAVLRELRPPDGGGERDEFGVSVRLSGDGRAALVGSYKNARQGTDVGRAHVFYCASKLRTHYVATNGSDVPGCGDDLASACRTLSYTRAARAVASGHTIRVHAGSGGFPCEDTSNAATFTVPITIESADTTRSVLFNCTVGVNGNGMQSGSRALWLTGSASLNGTVTLRRLQFIGGNATGSNGGGAVLVERVGSLVIEDCVFRSCHATAGPGGALLAVDVANVRLSRSEFENTSAVGCGGAVAILYRNSTTAASGGVTIDSSAFANGRALSSSGVAEGGAVCIRHEHIADSRSLTIRNVTVVACTAQSIAPSSCSTCHAFGGGISVRFLDHAQNCSATLDGAQLSNCSARTSGGNAAGGSLCMRYEASCNTSSVAVDAQTLVTGNSAFAARGQAEGGGLALLHAGTASRCEVDIAASQLLRNNATAGEGAVGRGGGAVATFMSASDSCGVFVRGPSSWTQNRVACYKGEARCSGGALAIVQAGYATNMSWTLYGGDGANSLTFRRNLVESTSGFAQGGALSMNISAGSNVSHIVFRGESDFTENAARSENGSAMGGALHINIFNSSNQAFAMEGTLAVHGNTLTMMSNGTFTRGGGVYMFCEICERFRAVVGGEGTFAENEVVTHSALSSNSAGATGGAIYAELDRSSDAEILLRSSLTFRSNRARAMLNRAYGGAATIQLFGCARSYVAVGDHLGSSPSSSARSASAESDQWAARFVNNSAEGGTSLSHGGGLYVQLASNSAHDVVALAGLEFLDNVATAQLGAHGGAISFFAEESRNTTLQVTECGFRNSSTSGTGSSGGALSVVAPSDQAITGGTQRQWEWVSTVSLTNCTVQHVRTDGRGGALRFVNGLVAVRNCSVRNATADGGGGCIALENSASLTLDRALLQSCSAGESTAGACIQHLGSGTIDVRETNLTATRDAGEIIRAPFISRMNWEDQTSTLKCARGHHLVNRSSDSFAAFALPWTAVHFRCCDTAPVSVVCESCPVGSYSLGYGSTRRNASCRACPRGADCHGGADIRARPGFWGYGARAGGEDADDEEVVLLSCPQGYCCSGMTACQSYTQCEGNRGGTLCGECMPGYSAAFGTTSCIADGDCGDPEYFAYAIATSLFLGIVLAVAASRCTQTDEDTDVIVTVFACYQMASFYFVNLDARVLWEEAVTGLFRFAVPMPEGMGSSPALCPVQGLTTAGKSTLSLFVPICALGISSLTAFLRFRLRRGNESGKRERTRVGPKQAAATAFWLGFVLAAPVLLGNLLDLFHCRSIDGDLLLYTDTSVQCITWWQVSAALCFLAVFSAAIAAVHGFNKPRSNEGMMVERTVAETGKHAEGAIEAGIGGAMAENTEVTADKDTEAVMNVSTGGTVEGNTGRVTGENTNEGTQKDAEGAMQVSTGSVTGENQEATDCSGHCRLFQFLRPMGTGFLLRRTAIAVVGILVVDPLQRLVSLLAMSAVYAALYSLVCTARRGRSLRATSIACEGTLMLLGLFNIRNAAFASSGIAPQGQLASTTSDLAVAQQVFLFVPMLVVLMLYVMRAAEKMRPVGRSR